MSAVVACCKSSGSRTSVQMRGAFACWLSASSGAFAPESEDRMMWPVPGPGVEETDKRLHSVSPRMAATVTTKAMSRPCTSLLRSGAKAGRVENWAYHPRQIHLLNGCGHHAATCSERLAVARCLAL